MWDYVEYNLSPPQTQGVSLTLEKKEIDLVRLPKAVT
jgi:hypothetical protein